MKKILLTLTALSVFTNYIGDASASVDTKRLSLAFNNALSTRNISMAADILRKVAPNPSAFQELANFLPNDDNFTNEIRNNLKDKLGSSVPSAGVVYEFLNPSLSSSTFSMTGSPTQTNFESDPVASLRSEIERLASQSEDFDSSEITSIASAIVSLAKNTENISMLSDIISSLLKSNENLYKTLAGSVSDLNSDSSANLLFQNIFDRSVEDSTSHGGIDTGDHKDEVEEKPLTPSTSLESVTQNKDESAEERTEYSTGGEKEGQDSSTTSSTPTSFPKESKEEVASHTPESIVTGQELGDKEPKIDGVFDTFPRRIDFDALDRYGDEEVVEIFHHFATRTARKLEQLRKNYTELSAEQAKQEGQKKVLSDQLNKKQKELDEAKNTVLTTSEQVKKQKILVENLRKEFETASERLQELNNSLQEIEIKRDSIVQEIVDLKTQIGEMEEVLKQRTEHMSGLSEQINLLQNQYEESQQSRKDMLAQIEEQKQVVERLQRNLEKAQTEIERWKDLRLGDTPESASNRLKQMDENTLNMFNKWKELGDTPEAARKAFAQQQEVALDRLREELKIQHENELAEKNKALEEQVELIRRLNEQLAMLTPPEPAFDAIPGTLGYTLATSTPENRLSNIATLKRILFNFKITTLDNFSKVLDIQGITDKGIQNKIWTAIIEGKTFTKTGPTIGSMDDFETKVAAALFSVTEEA